ARPVVGRSLVRGLRTPPQDVTARRVAEPWYQAKTEPSFEDMLTKLRKTLIAARFSAIRPGQPDPEIFRDDALACAAAAAEVGNTRYLVGAENPSVQVKDHIHGMTPLTRSHRWTDSEAPTTCGSG